MFLVFTRRGRSFIEKKAEEAPDKNFYLQIVQELEQQAVQALQIHREKRERSGDVI